LLLLFSGIGGVLLGMISFDYFTKAAIGAAVALILFSPIALVGSGIGGWVARLARSRGQ
jgi:hypothetical protein